MLIFAQQTVGREKYKFVYFSCIFTKEVYTNMVVILFCTARNLCQFTLQELGIVHSHTHGTLLATIALPRQHGQPLRVVANFSARQNYHPLTHVSPKGMIKFTKFQTAQERWNCLLRCCCKAHVRRRVRVYTGYKTHYPLT